MVNVTKRYRFHGGVHVAIGDRHQPRRNAAAVKLQNIGIVRRGSPGGGELKWDCMLLGQQNQPFDDGWIHVRTTKNYRPAAEPDVALLMLINRGAVRCVRHIDGNGDAWIHTSGSGLGTAEPDFFLHGADAVQVTAQR